ncbi:MAG TPA: alpha/beta hydrolase, partial [Oceanospirillales bacterium]|nr:alpha/beta hydrolase [Oceanospirillales bacterium]
MMTNIRSSLYIIMLYLSINLACYAQSNSVLDFSYNKINGQFSELLSMDIHTPDSGNNLPVVVFVHGGGWQIGDKASTAHINKRNFFINHGFVFVSVNYRLAPLDFYPTYPQDVAQAIAFVFNWIAKFKGDNKNVFLMGHSAGAHLAALVATDKSYLNTYGYAPTDLNGVILLDGAGYDIPAVVDFQTQNNNTDAVLMYHTAFGTDINTWIDASPINHVEESGSPPFQLFYVDTRRVSHLVSAAFSNKLNTHNNSA